MRRRNTSSRRWPARRSEMDRSRSASSAVSRATAAGVGAVSTRYSPGRSSVTATPSAAPTAPTSMPAGAAKRISSPLATRSAGRPAASDLPVVDDDEPVGETLGLAELVGGERTQTPSSRRRPRRRGRRCGRRGRCPPSARRGRPPRGRPTERERERQALALATGEPLCRGTGDVFEADQAEQFTRVAWVVVVGGEEPERSSGAHHRVGAATLEHHADERRDGRPVASGIVAEDADVAGVGDAVALQRLDRGRLAGAVRAEQAEDLARLGAERDAVDGDRPAVADDELFDFDGRHRRRG